AANGSVSDARPAAPPPSEPVPSLTQPETQVVQVKLAPPQITAPPPPSVPLAPVVQPPTQAVVAPTPTTLPAKRLDTFLAGPAGEELRDYSYRYNSDGSVRETIIYFYGDDLRATQATGFDPLRREAVYQGRVDANRLFAARKLSDNFYVGDASHERRDLRR